MFPQLFGKYVLEREIAAGGMARVYLATLRGAVGFEKRLVVKQIRPELASDEAFVRRFVDEAKTAVELSHPNIVPVYELGVEQGIFYIAMELCEGLTLSEVLNDTGPLSPEEGAYVGIEICRALDYAHRRAGIVHRDVTPRNVMLDDEGAVRLIDFGIAAPVTLPDEAGTGQLELFGSPGHMPPEQLAGRSLTPATDVFAVGALLAEAWTGKPPFRRATPADCVEALRTPPPRIDEQREQLSPLSELVASSMALKPDDRPQTTEAFSRPLREFVKSADLGDVARRIGERVQKTRRRLMASSPWIDGETVTGSSDPVITKPSEQRPRAPSIGDTQTFAVRNDLVEWTRKLPSAPPPPPDAVVEPVPPSEVSSTRPSARDAEPARSDEPAPATSNAERTSERASRSGLVAIAAVAVAIAGVVYVVRSTPEPKPGDSTRSSTPSASVAPPAFVSVAPPVSAEAPPASAPVPRPSSSVPRMPTAPASSDIAGEKTGKATLNLTSMPPGAQVSVGGRSFTTPAMGVTLPPGDYTVNFFISALQLRAGAQVKLVAGGTRSVNVDFTRESPAVYVH